jgi:hypothetical protein
LLVISIGNNPTNQLIIDRLSNCFNGGSQPNQACFDSSMSEVQRNPTARYYVAGVDPSSAIERNIRFPVYRESVNWKNVFKELDSPKSIERLRPLSVKLIDLLGQKFFQA